ncbi:uncharacterized protein LOC142644207 [Castanea sativa]|uniref:uncharacterized protein LOC142644207 n=1 Tax=Castanea sativa TaxID=21020 RepID=UPI003F651947
MEPVISYIRYGQLPSNSSKAKKVRVWAVRFTILNGELYERGFSMPYLKCLAPNEATYVLREIHEGVYGNHSEPQSLVGKTIRAGYFWPNMQKDATELVKKYDKCQQFSNVQHYNGKTYSRENIPYDVSGVDSNFIVHRLNVDPRYPPKKQRPRKSAKPHIEAVKEEVEI